MLDLDVLIEQCLAEGDACRGLEGGAFGAQFFVWQDREVAKSFSLAGSGSEAVDGLAGQGTLDGLIHPQCGEVFGDFLQVHPGRPEGGHARPEE